MFNGQNDRKYFYINPCLHQIIPSIMRKEIKLFLQLHHTISHSLTETLSGTTKKP